MNENQHRLHQIDPSGKTFTVFTLSDGGDPIAEGVLVSKEGYAGFDPNLEYWYFTQSSYSTGQSTSLVLEITPTDTSPNRTPGDAGFTRKRSVEWYQSTGGPDLGGEITENVPFGLSLNITENTDQRTWTFDLQWFSTDGKDLSFGDAQRSIPLSREHASTSTTWYVAV